MNYQDFLKDPVTRNLAASLILLAVALLCRTLMTRAVLRHVSQPEARLRWLVGIRNTLLLVFVLGLVIIWARDLRTLAVSLVAIAAAFVIATKELILCFSGSLLRTTGRVYSVGDRIEIGTCRGDVIDHNIFTTTLLEIGPGHSFHMHTGRTIAVPNSKLLDTPVINESAMQQYVVHVFSVPLSVRQDWRKAEETLREAAASECQSFIGEARLHMARLEATHGFSTPSVEPRVAVQIPEPDVIHLLVRIPTPVGRQGPLEQAILRRFLDRFYACESPMQ